MSADAHNRRKARVLALQVLYAVEQGSETDIAAISDYLAREYALSPANAKYGRELVAAALRLRERTDAMIRKQAANWDLERMAVIDRNILRMAVAELSEFPAVPAKVVIDEAVELAKEYGAEGSGRFVNGLIDSLYKKCLAVEADSHLNKDGGKDGTERSSESAHTA